MSDREQSTMPSNHKKARFSPFRPPGWQFAGAFGVLTAIMLATGWMQNVLSSSVLFVSAFAILGALAAHWCDLGHIASRQPSPIVGSTFKLVAMDLGTSGRVCHRKQQPRDQSAILVRPLGIGTDCDTGCRDTARRARCLPTRPSGLPRLKTSNGCPVAGCGSRRSGAAIHLTMKDWRTVRRRYRSL